MEGANLSTYPWYGIVSGGDLEQGDLFLDCPTFLIPPEAARHPGEHPFLVERRQVIVISQSCDLVMRADGRFAVEDVLLLPVYTRAELSGHKTYGKPQGWEE